MLNTELLNGNALASSPLPLTITQDVIAFNGYGLQNAGIITSLGDWDDLANVELNSFNFPRDDGGAVLSKYYRGREIRAKITIKAATAADFQTLLDGFKKGIRTTEGFLDILPPGTTETRRIKATCTKIAFGRQHYNVTYITAEVTFQALEPFFYAVNAQSLQLQAQSGSFSAELTNDGSADSLPTLYFIFGAGTAATELQINAFGLSLTIPSTYANNDVLIVDSKNKSVTKNGVEIDYTGQFPKFPPGSCPFQIAITGTSLLDLTAIIPKNYL